MSIETPTLSRPERIALAICVAAIVIAAVVAWQVLPRGLDMEDESAYIYLLAHPDIAIQFLDHRLWGSLGQLLGTPPIAFWRGFALALSCASAWCLATCYYKSRGTAAPKLVLAMTIFGVFGLLAAIRPTMNYGVSAFVFGNFAAAMILLAGRPGGRAVGSASLLAGIALALLFTARFPAALLGLIVFSAWLWWQAQRPRRAIAEMWVAMALTLALLWLLGWDFATMLEAARLLALQYHGLDVVLRDGARIAVVAGLAFGVAFGFSLIERRFGARWSSAAFILFVVAGWAVLLATNRGLISGPVGDVSDPFARNGAQLKRQGYWLWLVMLSALSWLFIRNPKSEQGFFQRVAAQRHLVFLAFAACFTFAGTNTGILQRSVMNGGVLFLLLGVLLIVLVEQRRIERAGAMIVASIMIAGWTVLIILNSIVMPYWLAGRLSDQTAALPAPALVQGHLVTPAIAEHGAEIRQALERVGFDWSTDALIHNYQWTGEGLLSGAKLANWPFFPGHNYPDSDAAQAYACLGIVREVERLRPARLFALNIEYHHPLRSCLAENGIDVDGEPLVYTGTVTVREVVFKRD